VFSIKLSQNNSLIQVDFKYDPGTVAAVKALPGARFNKDHMGAYWTIPPQILPQLFEKFNLSPGYLYPDCMGFLNRDIFKNLIVDIKYDRVKIQGTSAPRMLESIRDICSIEYIKNNVVVKEYLGETIYNKNNIIVFKFPPGLYWRILDFITQCGIKPVVHPYPESPPLNPISINISPRYYQDEAVNKIISKQISRGTLVMATGAGKTILAAMITAALGLNTIFYTYSTDLLEQTAQVFEEVFRQKIGRVGGDYFDIQPITVATVQTVYSCFELKDERWDVLSGYLNDVNLMFIDEGHMLGAETLFKVSQITDAYYSYALTATPEREDGKELLIEAGTGPAINIISEEELVKQGYILPVEVELIKVEHAKYIGRTYNAKYKRAIVNNEYRNDLICDAVKRHQGKQIIVLVKEIKHGEKLAQQLNAPFIHGSSKDRTAVLDAFKNRHIDILIASSILKQGVDIPEAEVLVLAHGGSSSVELIQKIGRVRRPAPNKNKGVVVDFFDYCPTDSNDIFKQQAYKRYAIYRQKGFQVYNHTLDMPAIV